MVHVHGDVDGLSVRTGCDPSSDLAEECPLCLTKIVAELQLNGKESGIGLDALTPRIASAPYSGRVSMPFGARAPPAIG